ncbi:MAG: endolytic transglycosylase MltG [Candidatus Azobacteroides sp.]|nr:endolytic transglycosylase MltG [Candidatus Azobacteroides sp.]
MALTRKAKILGVAGIMFVLLALIISGGYYYFYKKSNFFPEKTVYIYVYPNMTFDRLMDQLKESGMVDEGSFQELAKWKKYDRNMKVGRYAVKPEMSNSDLLKILIAGRQTPLQVKFNNIRTVPQFAGRIASQLMADSLSFLHTFQDEKFIESLGFTQETLPAMFIPNTYELYWTTSPEKFCERMKAEFDRFWNEERRNKAKEIGLTPVEVSTLASIVEEETNKTDEFPIVAGLYINRLKTGMMLQADPTVKYAVGDFSLRRVLNVHLAKESPYNTYRNYGLPPGPIRFPSIQVIDAVLNYTHHNYIYMCAKEDLSGRHNFAMTGAQHAANRAKYTAALNKLGIYR